MPLKSYVDFVSGPQFYTRKIFKSWLIIKGLPSSKNFFKSLKQGSIIKQQADFTIYKALSNLLSHLLIRNAKNIQPHITDEKTCLRLLW